MTQAARYERSEARQGYCSGHYDRNLTTTSGDVTLHIPRLKGVSFETAIIERYRRRESSVNEDGFREVLGAAEGMKEDKASWVSFFQWLRGRGLEDRKSTRLNSSHNNQSRMPSSA